MASTSRLSKLLRQRQKTHFDEWFGCSLHPGVVILGFEQRLECDGPKSGCR